MKDEKRIKLFLDGLKKVKPNWTEPMVRLNKYIYVGTPGIWPLLSDESKNEWGLKLPFPTREEIHNSRQMGLLGIQPGEIGQYESSNEGVNLLKVKCVCGTQLKDVHIIADPTRGYVNHKLYVGKCCVVKLVDTTAFHKHCPDCNSLAVKRKQVYCEECREKRCEGCWKAVGKMTNGNYFKYCYNCK